MSRSRATGRTTMATVAAAAAAIGVVAFGSGCGAPSLNPCTGDPAIDLGHDDPKCRIDAAVLAAEQHRVDLIPRLIENLRDPNGDVRMLTGVALRKLSGIDVGYRAFASAAEQEAAIETWRHWWDTRGREDDGSGGLYREEMSKR